MASEEILNAAISQLKAEALEAYAILRDIMQRPVEAGDKGKIAAGALKLAQCEAAMITLQEYAAALLAPKNPPAGSASATPVMVTEDDLSEVENLTEDDLQRANQMSEEQLLEKSPTYKRSIDDAKLKAGPSKDPE